MGWQDAPLASPGGTQPAWASAPVAQPAPAGEPTVGGFLSRVRARVQQSVGTTAGGIDQIGSDAANALGLSSVGDWFKRDQQTDADPTVRRAQTVLDTTPAVSVDAHPVLGRVAKYGEMGLGMVPDVALATSGIGIAPYAAGVEGDTARRRAENDKRADPSIMDYLAAVPSTAANVALQRFGVGGKGASLLQRVGREGAAQGGISGADYLGTTAGTQTPVTLPELADRTAEGAATGIVLGGGMHLTSHGLAALRGRYAANGVDTSGIPDDQLVEGSLNGSIHQGVGPSDVADILKSQGVPPESVSPDKAATFADRIAAARTRPNTNDLGAKEVARQNGINEDIAAGETHPAWATAPVARTPAPDVTMTAAPEGIIPSDNTGAQAGVDRHRAASENVLATAQQHAERDPVIKEVLDSSLSPDTKVGILLDRLHKYVGSLPTPEIPTEPNVDQAPTPFQEPTADAARSHPIMPASQLDRELAVTKHTESHGDPNAVSPKGARGTMQTMPGTLRDPGYGVRPAADDSPAELERVGRDYYTALRSHYGSADKAWAAYNAGPGALDGAVRKYGADWLDHMPEETRNYVRKNMAAVGAEPTDTVYRGPAPTEDPFRSDSGFERTDAPEEPLERTGLGESRTATGDSSRPFMEETDTPAGEEPGFWERRAEMQADDLRKEWEASKQEPPPAGADPSQKYGANNYGQRPHMPDGADTWAMTPEGHIADVNGKPVAFRNVKDAAKFAAKNKLGGDFEPQVWTTNSARVVLTRRAGSDYGERGPRPDASAGPAEPPSGRSGDTSQRLLSDAEKAPLAGGNGPPPRDTAPPAPTPPETPPSAPAPVSEAAEPPLRAESGSVSDQTVPRGTENIPAKPMPEPRNFFQAVRDHLAQRQAKTGVRTRISAEDAISNGVQADSIYIDPKAKYPRLKIWATKVFSNERGPLRSRAQPTKIVSLDHLGDRMDPEQFGVPAGDGVQDHRLAPEHAGTLLQQSFDRDPAAHDRYDERYDPYHEELRQTEEHDREEIERDALHEEAAGHGLQLTDEELDDALHHRAAGATHADAVEAALWESAARSLDRSADESGDEFYRSVAHGVHEAPIGEENGGSAAESGGRSEGEPTDTGRSSAGGEEPRSLDLIPGRETDQRDALQRRADEGLKPDAEQKAAGSDGGLFDTRDTTGALFEKGKGPKVSRRGMLGGGASLAAIAATAKLLPGRHVGEPGGFELENKSYPTTPRLLDSVEGALKGPIDAAGPLREVASNSSNPAYRMLARVLMHHLKGVRLLAVKGTYNDTGVEMPHDVQGEGVLGVTRFGLDGKPEIWLLNQDPDVNGFNERTLLHEGLHAALLQHFGKLSVRLAGNDPTKLRDDGRALEATPRPGAADALSRVNKLWQEYSDKVEADQKAGKLSERDDPEGAIVSASENPDEMLAYAATHPDVQRYMREARGDSGKGLWQRFVDTVRRALGMDATPENATLLSDTIGATSSLLRDASERPNPRVPGKPSDDIQMRETVRHQDPEDRLISRLADRILEPDAHPAEILHAVRDMVKSPKKTTKGLLKSLDRFGSAYAYSADGALRTLSRHYNAPTLTKIADMFQARRGAADSTDRTYDEAVHRQIGRFVNERLMSTLDPFIGKAGSLERIRDLLAEPGRTVRATPAEHAAAKDVRKLLDDVIAYRKEAGEDIGEVKNYFPRVLDAMAVAKDSDGFTKAATKLYREMGADNPEESAQEWMQRVLDTDAGINGGEEFVRASGKPASSKSREFGPAADRLLRDYYQKDASLVLHDYIMGSVRRAEQARRFGPKGAVGSKERGAWMKEHGTKSQWDVMLDNIRDELRASGEGAANVPTRVREIVDGNLGRLSAIGAKTSAAVAGLHAWNQLAHLERVTFASLGDAAMGYTRYGGKQGTQHLIGTLKEAVRLVETLGKRDPSDARRWAEAFGVVGHGNASALIRSRLDQNPSLPQHAGFLDKFYRKVGLEQWTQGGRAQSAQGAKVFLDTLAHDLMSGSARTRQRAGFYLKEAGIKDPQAFGEWLRNAPSRAELMSDKGHAAQYATAVIRMSNDTVLMPNRAQKPTWASHPVGSLLFALQSYNAAFTQNVLKRVGRLGVEAVKQKDPKLLGPAAGLVPLIAVTAAQNYMRTAIFGGKQDDDLTSWALTILDRAGLTGMASPIFNAFGGLRYHRSTGSALEGSILGSATQAADAIGGLFLQNSGNTNTAERKVAGLVYDLVVNPTENLVGAKYVRGAGGTAAIMGTGNRKGGVLPADRDAFIDAVAGPGKT